MRWIPTLPQVTVCRTRFGSCLRVTGRSTRHDPFAQAPPHQHASLARSRRCGLLRNTARGLPRPRRRCHGHRGRHLSHRTPRRAHCCRRAPVAGCDRLPSCQIPPQTRAHEALERDSGALGHCPDRSCARQWRCSVPLVCQNGRAAAVINGHSRRSQTRPELRSGRSGPARDDLLSSRSRVRLAPGAPRFRSPSAQVMPLPLARR
jgi:hypothetical protein